MDLQRRLAAGELAELMGPLRAEVRPGVPGRTASGPWPRQVVARASPGERALLEAYAAGVNAGLGALGARPFDTCCWGRIPSPGGPEDSRSACWPCSSSCRRTRGQRQSRLGYMRDVLPPALLAFLAPAGHRVGRPRCAAPRSQPAVPGPEVCDLRKLKVRPAQRRRPGTAGAGFPGSNNWALGGGRTRDGRAIVANDMHLAITVPNTWYRVSLAWPEAGGERRVTGVTLPGTPPVAAGSNGRVAWGFTNSYGDFRDLVVLERCGSDPDSLPDPRRAPHPRDGAGDPAGAGTGGHECWTLPGASGARWWTPTTGAGPGPCAGPPTTRKR